MEDIVLLDRVRSLPRGKRAFKLILSRREIDMAVYDTQEHTIEEYEIKHSKGRGAEQRQFLLDDEINGEVAAKYGKITRKCVLYRGSTGTEDGIEYLNAEDYLKAP